jgi:hypothetical protein
MTNPKVADLAGPGIGNYEELERLQQLAHAQGNPEGDFRRQAFYRRQPLQRAEPDHGHRASHR